MDGGTINADRVLPRMASRFYRITNVVIKKGYENTSRCFKFLLRILGRGCVYCNFRWITLALRLGINLLSSMTNKEWVDKAIEEFFKHPAMEYAGGMITLNAVRTGGKGWGGEKLDVPLKKILEEALALGEAKGRNDAVDLLETSTSQTPDEWKGALDAARSVPPKV